MSSAKRPTSVPGKMRVNMRPLREKTFVDRIQRLEKMLEFQPRIEELIERVEKLEQTVSKKFSSLGREVKNYERTNYQQLTTYMELRRIFDNPAPMPALRGYAISPQPMSTSGVATSS